jgi:hypothetical protein
MYVKALRYFLCISTIKNTLENAVLGKSRNMTDSVNDVLIFEINK